MQNPGVVRTVSVLSLALSFYSFAPIVIAADIDNSISYSGPNSESTTEVNSEKNTTVSSSQDAQVTNSLNFKLSTGNNKIHDVTESEGLETGDIQASLSLNNEVTDFPTNLDGKNESDSINSAIDKTGPNSSTNSSTTINRETSIDLNKSADIKNNLSLSSETGGNTIAYVTKVGLLKSGNIEFDLDLSNRANTREIDKDKNKITDCIECNKKETPVPTPNATPSPEQGKGGAEVPGSTGIVPAGSDVLPLLILVLTYALLSARMTYDTGRRKSKNL
jgi:hypothetical protein